MEEGEEDSGSMGSGESMDVCLLAVNIARTHVRACVRVHACVLPPLLTLPPVHTGPPPGCPSLACVRQAGMRPPACLCVQACPHTCRGACTRKTEPTPLVCPQTPQSTRRGRARRRR